MPDVPGTQARFSCRSPRDRDAAVRREVPATHRRVHEGRCAGGVEGDVAVACTGSAIVPVESVLLVDHPGDAHGIGPHMHLFQRRVRTAYPHIRVLPGLQVGGVKRHLQPEIGHHVLCGGQDAAGGQIGISFAPVPVAVVSSLPLGHVGIGKLQLRRKEVIHERFIGCLIDFGQDGTKQADAVI